MENNEVQEAERKAIQRQTQSEHRFLRCVEKILNIFYTIVIALTLLTIAYLTVLTIITR